MRCVHIYTTPMGCCSIQGCSTTMLGTFWQPCPPWRRRQQQPERLLLLGLTWNAITFDTPPAFVKDLGLLSKSEIQIAKRRGGGGGSYHLFWQRAIHHCAKQCLGKKRNGKGQGEVLKNSVTIWLNLFLCQRQFILQNPPPLLPKFSTSCLHPPINV